MANVYDIAVLDRDVPRLAGDEIAKRIVASGMPILMLTAVDRLGGRGDVGAVQRAVHDRRRRDDGALRSPQQRLGAIDMDQLDRSTAQTLSLLGLAVRAQGSARSVDARRLRLVEAAAVAPSPKR